MTPIKSAFPDSMKREAFLVLMNLSWELTIYFVGPEFLEGFPDCKEYQNMEEANAAQLFTTLWTFPDF